MVLDAQIFDYNHFGFLLPLGQVHQWLSHRQGRTMMKSWKRTDWILNASRKFDGDVNEQLVRKQQIPQDLEPCVDQRPIRVST